MLKVWDIDSGQEVASYLGHTHGLYRVAFSPDGRSIASARSCPRGPVVAHTDQLALALRQLRVA
ncbi:MAG TPA: hypothetical protein VKD72_07405 [Gemmataceae bacterium]|nr:hypothetical protein [Gemmataceae bacterium]